MTMSSNSKQAAGSGWRARLHGFFERHRYDFVFYRRLEKRAMMPYLDLKPGDKVCELGCFNGANARALSHRFHCTVDGLDVDPDVIRLAQSFNKTEQTSFVVASAEHLPFANENFDKIYGISVLEHFSDGQTALREARRCLKPGGVLVVTTDSFGLGELLPGTQKTHREKYFVSRYYTIPQLKGELESAGFQVSHAEPVLRHWSTGFLFELSIRVPVVKSAAFFLLPLLGVLELLFGSTDSGYMIMVSAVKPLLPGPE
jgi:ubiquinone/menaquinone biosynthesis C-methylase UbiE